MSHYPCPETSNDLWQIFMNNSTEQSDNAVEEQLTRDIRNALDASLENIDSAHLSELDTIRQQALASKPVAKSQRWFSVAIAASLLAAILIPQLYQPAETSAPQITSAVEDSIQAIDYSNENVDIYLAIDPYFLETIEMLAIIGETMIGETMEEANHSGATYNAS